MRNVTYIFHSGFLVELTDCYLIFDYYKGELPKLDPEKPVLVFASHVHEDHYNPEVFNLLKAQEMSEIHAYLGMGIKEKTYPEGIPCMRMDASKTYELPYGIKVQTLHSTDRGVAFLLETGDGVIYHAGDLNDWTWKEESDEYNSKMSALYRKILKRIDGREIDLAFLPLDIRQEEYYANGMSYFLSRMIVHEAYPMHYWERPEVIDWFLRDYPCYNDIVKRTESTS